jgi:hypothetical protein
MSADALSSFDPAAPHYPDVDRTVIAAAREFAPGMSTGAHSHDRAQFDFAIRGMTVATTEIDIGVGRGWLYSLTLTNRNNHLLRDCRNLNDSASPEEN